jgi:hypothetical protein
MSAAIFLARADRIAAKAERIRQAQAEVARVRKRLADVNKYAERGGSCNASITVFKGDQYGNGAVSMPFSIPFGVLQQSVIYQLARVERELVAAENSPL